MKFLIATLLCSILLILVVASRSGRYEEGTVIEKRSEKERAWVEKEFVGKADGTVEEKDFAVNVDDKDWTLTVVQKEENKDGKIEITRSRVVYVSEEEFGDYEVGKYYVIKDPIYEDPTPIGIYSPTDKVKKRFGIIKEEEENL